MRIVMDDVTPENCWIFFEEFLKKSDFTFPYKEELIAKWEQYKKEVIESAKSELEEIK